MFVHKFPGIFFISVWLTGILENLGGGVIPEEGLVSGGLTMAECVITVWKKMISIKFIFYNKYLIKKIENTRSHKY